MRRLPPPITRLSVLALAAVLSCNSDGPAGPGGGPGGGGKDTTIVPTDTIPPSQVTDPAVTYSEATGRATFSWSAPHDDTPDQPVDRYEIRYALTLSAPPVVFWDLSIPVSNPPIPAAPGAPQQVTISGLTQFRNVWVGVRSYDAAGNRSPGSPLVSARVPGPTFSGRCVDVYTGNPVEGLPVQISAGILVRDTTNANGEFSRGDLPPGAINVQISDNVAIPDYHFVNQTFVMDSDTTYCFEMIPVQATLSPTLGGMSLLAFFKQMTFFNATNNPFLAKWKQTPVRCYINPFVNSSGVDYAAEARAAAQRWMDRTGREIFTFVSTPPDTGIVVHERPPQTGTAVTITTLDQDKHPILAEITVDNDLADANLLFKVMLHEFGHTIRLDHTSFPEFIMFVGQPLPDAITPDEVNLAILHQAMPVRVDMRIYTE
ncbi:MAG: matrixin family metalloprotease [Candidatus Krumholzibacteriia bacterium]